MLNKLRLSIQLISMFAIGFILILIGILSDSIHDLVVDTIGINKDSGIAEFVDGKLGDATWLGAVLLFGGVVVYFFSSGVEGFFKNKISPIITGHVDRLSEELNQVGDDTRNLLGARMLDSIVAASPPNEVKAKLRFIHEKAYGRHCGNDQGLYAAVEDKLSMFYDPEKPHRSDYHQTVTVVENSIDSITWHEVCSYKMHTVCLENKKEEDINPIAHVISFSSTIKVAELSLEGEKPKYKLSILVDEKTIFDSVSDLYLENGLVRVKDDIDGVVVEQRSDSLKIQIMKVHNIKKPWTEVEIKETSTIKDDYFISRRNEPTCGAKITMNLPDDWWFELISFGHPEDWTIHQHPANTLSAWTKSWLLPGITFFCKWERPKMEQGELLSNDSDRNKQ